MIMVSLKIALSFESVLYTSKLFFTKTRGHIPGRRDDNRSAWANYKFSRYGDKYHKIVYPNTHQLLLLTLVPHSPNELLQLISLHLTYKLKHSFARYEELV